MPFVGVSKGSDDFSRSRVGPLVAKNPDSIGKYVVDTDNIGLKRVWEKTCCFAARNQRKGRGVAMPRMRLAFSPKVNRQDLHAGVAVLAQGNDARCWVELAEDVVADPVPFGHEHLPIKVSSSAMRVRTGGATRCGAGHVSRKY